MTDRLEQESSRPALPLGGLPEPERGLRALMGPRVWLTGLVGVLAAVATHLAIDFLSPTAPDEGRAAAGLQRLETRDRSLTERVQEALLGEEALKELDLDAATEQDRRFLLELLRTGSTGARTSAMRALVELQEPRAVGVLSRLPGTAEDREAWCAGGLEILRNQTREGAAEGIVEVLAEPPGRVDSRCLDKLRQAFSLIGGATPEILEALLESASPRAQRFALEHWSGPASETHIERVVVLASSADGPTSSLADAWLKARGFERVPE